MEKEPNVVKSKQYHHGDLRRALIEQAALVIDAEGIEALTQRRQIAVSVYARVPTDGPRRLRSCTGSGTPDIDSRVTFTATG